MDHFRVVALASIIAVCSACIRPGTGYINMDGVPDAAKAGEPIEVRIETGMTDGRVERWKKLHFCYRLAGEPNCVPPKQHKIINDKRADWVFVIPPFPPGTSGEIEFHVEYHMDEHPGRVEGSKKIKLEG